MENIGIFLNSQPFIALFLVIGLGYAVGQIKIGGLSLGIGAVLFVGLGVGAIAPKAAPPGLVGTIGLVLFLYGIGIQYGKDFFKGLMSPLGIKANLLATFAVLMGCAAAMAMARLFNFGSDFVAGMFAGSLTSTATLQAAMEASGSKNPAVGYAIAYPFGVFGPILCFYLAKLVFRPKIEVPPPSRLVTAEARVGDRGLTGKTVAELLALAPEGVDLLMVRRNGMNMLPEPTMVLQADDFLSVVGFPEVLAELKAGEVGEARDDRRHLDYMRVFVSKPGFIGMRLTDLPFPKDVSIKVIQVRRGDVDLLPKPEMQIEYGDQLGVVVESAQRGIVSRFFGDSIKAETEFSFVSLALGLVAGGLIGLIPIPVPVIGSVKLGAAGGPLVMSLILGYIGRLGPLNWRMPVVANIILRNLGLTLFLAGVGLSSGAPFVQNIGGSGLYMLLAGMVVLLTVVLTVLLIGYYVLGMNFDDVLGIASGATGNPAILAYASQLAPTGKADIGYAMIFPGVGTILKIIVVQVMLAMSSGSVPLP
ncbi:TrkA C-terminal domain-containing protein [uncultured Desulfobulbus sp.]|uniref:aspartate:alanine exchanger family transporter n=1 Tax=uncultured Desulfobulbus sp. TaxID=239745 RepID=UPI0029C6BB55|nr:TrkA C-terminal domain-containing protein [uncultured Desulfobulbus sp.]